MKRFITLLLVLAMTLGLAACAGTGSEVDLQTAAWEQIPDG